MIDNFEQYTKEPIYVNDTIKSINIIPQKKLIAHNKITQLADKNNTNFLLDIKQKFPKLFFTEIFTDKYILSAEKDDGFIEYKRTLIDCDEKKTQKYATQMRWRISENIKTQCATYFLGVDDDGTIIGLDRLCDKQGKNSKNKCSNLNLLHDENELEICIEKFVKIASSIGASITRIDIIHVKKSTILKIIVKIKKIKNNFLVDFDSFF